MTFSGTFNERGSSMTKLRVALRIRSFMLCQHSIYIYIHMYIRSFGPLLQRYGSNVVTCARACRSPQMRYRPHCGDRGEANLYNPPPRQFCAEWLQATAVKCDQPIKAGQRERAVVAGARWPSGASRRCPDLKPGPPLQRPRVPKPRERVT